MLSFLFMDLLEKLLDYYGMTNEEYARLTRPLNNGDLPHFDAFADLENIVARIKQSLDLKEKIVIYGDYDADGVLATSVLVHAFKLLGVEVGYYLPNRYQDGYGINVEKVNQFHEKGYRLIITVDNGVNANDAIEMAKAHGIDVIITDHHEILGDIPPSIGVLHPFLMREPYPMCGAAMALVLAARLLSHYEPYHIALAALATISDMMPLRGGNRDLVRLGLMAINKHKFAQITHLIDAYPIDEGTIGMKIAPAINAIGRLIENSNINRLVHYFTMQDEDELEQLSAWIIEVNRSRKEKMNQAFDVLPEIGRDSRSFVYLSNEKEGLIGLLANRLVMQYAIPVIVFTVSSDDSTKLVGSARSPIGYDLVEAFAALKPYIIKGGGHANAGGLTIDVNGYDKFEEAFTQYFSQIDAIITSKDPIALTLSDVNWDNYRIVNSFAPFGHDFKGPRFIIKGLASERLTFIKDGKYLVTKLSLDSKLLSFAISREMIQDYKRIDLQGRFTIDRYKKAAELVFQADSFAPSAK